MIAAVVLLVVSAALFYKRLNSEGNVSAVDGPAHLVPGDATPPAAGANTPQQSGEAAPLSQPAQPDGVSANGKPRGPVHLKLSEQAQTAGGKDALPYHLTGANNSPATHFRIVEKAGTFNAGKSPAAGPSGTARANKVAKLTPAPMPPEGIGSANLRKAAASGDPRAQFEVAARFAKGDGVARDFSAAARWYSRAAAQGFAPAQYRLAALYERGRGLKRDLSRARIWYQRAAEAGNVKAMHNLAVIHTKSAGQTPDYASASQWFAKAAEHGLSDSQFNLAILHQNGLGVSKDLKQAYKWFLLAAKSGDAEAAKRVQALALQILPQDKIRIEQAVASWTAKSEKAAANEVAPATKSWTKTAAANPAPKPEALVARTQSLLNALGYDAGAADGLMGPKTRAAIKAFQGSVGMDQTGIANQDLVSQLEMRIG